MIFTPGPVLCIKNASPRPFLAGGAEKPRAGRRNLEMKQVSFRPMHGFISLALFLEVAAARLAGFPVAFTLAGVALIFAAVGVLVGVEGWVAEPSPFF